MASVGGEASKSKKVTKIKCTEALTQCERGVRDSLCVTVTRGVSQPPPQPPTPHPTSTESYDVTGCPSWPSATTTAETTHREDNGETRGGLETTPLRPRPHRNDALIRDFQLLTDMES